MRPCCALAVLVALLIVPLVLGCGGGGPDDAAPGGSINVGVRFPERGAVQTAKIPTRAESVRIVVLAPPAGSGLKNSAGTPGSRLVPDTILNRPSGGGAAQARITRIPVGAVVVKAVAHPQENGNGPALADAKTATEIREGRTTTVLLSLVTIVDRVIAMPRSLLMLVGEKAQIIAEARDAAGAVIIGAPLTYGSDNASVAAADSKGLVAARGLGSTKIRVRHEKSGKEAVVSVRVIEARIVRVDVTPARPATVVGWPLGFIATAIDDLGRPRPGAKFDWSVRDPSMGTIDSSGVFTPAKIGMAEVVAKERTSGVEGVGLAPVADWVVTIDWLAGEDPDLHVFDTMQKNHAYFGNATVLIGELIADDITSPGVEAFAGNTSVPGRYPVAVNYFRGQGDMDGRATLLVSGIGPVIVVPFELARANGDDGYPVTSPTASWDRPFDVVVSPSGAVSSAPSDLSIKLGPPGSRTK